MRSPRRRPSACISQPGALTLTHGRFSATAGKTATVHLKLSRKLAGKVHKLKSLAVIVTVTPSGAAKTVAHSRCIAESPSRRALSLLCRDEAPRIPASFACE